MCVQGHYKVNIGFELGRLIAVHRHVHKPPNKQDRTVNCEQFPLSDKRPPERRSHYSMWWRAVDARSRLEGVVHFCRRRRLSRRRLCRWEKIEINCCATLRHLCRPLASCRRTTPPTVREISLRWDDLDCSISCLLSPAIPWRNNETILSM